jgi:hypothetical protein
VTPERGQVKSRIGYHGLKGDAVAHRSACSPFSGDADPCFFSDNDDSDFLLRCMPSRRPSLPAGGVAALWGRPDRPRRPGEQDDLG